MNNLEALVESAISKIKKTSMPQDDSKIGKARRAYAEAAGALALAKRDFEKTSAGDKSWDDMRKAAALATHDFMSAHYNLIRAEEDRYE